MIQFSSVTILYQINSNLSDNEFLYIDLFVIIPLAFLMGYTRAYNKLTKYVPGSSLVSFPILMSVIG